MSEFTYRLALRKILLGPVKKKPPCIKFKYMVDKVKLLFDHGGELYKSEKYQHVEESRM